MSVAGVVLAAGASQRMGATKALLRVGERPLLDLLTDALRGGGCRPVLAVVAQTTERAVRRHCRLDRVELVLNPKPSLGQIASLRCALERVPDADGMLVVLVDQGRVAPDTVRAVRRALRSAPLAVARFQGAPGHPTAFARAQFGALFSEETDRRGARAVVEARAAHDDVAWVDVDDPGVVRNLNTLAAYRSALDGLLAECR